MIFPMLNSTPLKGTRYYLVAGPTAVELKLPIRYAHKWNLDFVMVDRRRLKRAMRRYAAGK